MLELNLLSKLAGNQSPASRPLPTPSPIPVEYASAERPWVAQRATPQQLQEWGVNTDDFMVGGGRMNFAAGGAKPIAGGSGSTIQAGSSAATPTVKPKMKLPVARGVQKAGSLLREMLKEAYANNLAGSDQRGQMSEWGRPTGVRPDRQNPYQTMEARSARAGQMANRIQQTYTPPPPIGTQDNMPSMPKAPSPFLRDKEYDEATKANEYVSQLRNARLHADVAGGFNDNPQALQQVNRSYQTQSHNPQAQQAYGTMTQGANRAADYTQAKQTLLQKNPNLANADHVDNKEFISSLKSTYGDNYRQQMENNPQELLRHHDKYTASRATQPAAPAQPIKNNPQELLRQDDKYAASRATQPAPSAELVQQSIQPNKTASHEDYEQVWQGVFDQLRKEGANEDFLLGMMKEAFDLNGFVQPIAKAIKPVGDYLKGLSSPTDITGELTNRHQIIPNVDNRLLGGILGAGGGLGLANLLGMNEGAGKLIFPALGGFLGSGGLSSAMNHWKDQPGFGHNKVPLLTASQYRANPLVDASSAVKN